MASSPNRSRIASTAASSRSPPGARRLREQVHLRGLALDQAREPHSQGADEAAGVARREELQGGLVDLIARGDRASTWWSASKSAHSPAGRRRQPKRRSRAGPPPEACGRPCPRGASAALRGPSGRRWPSPARVSGCSSCERHAGKRSPRIRAAVCPRSPRPRRASRPAHPVGGRAQEVHRREDARPAQAPGRRFGYARQVRQPQTLEDLDQVGVVDALAGRRACRGSTPASPSRSRSTHPPSR